MYIPSFLSLILIIKFGTSALIEERENNKFNSILDAAVQLANNNFNHRLQTVILSKDVSGLLVDNFLKRFKGTVVIEVKKDGIPPEQIVVFVESLKSFRNILDILKPDLKGKSLLHSRAKFVIVLLKRSHRLEVIFRILWSYDVTNVVILMRQKKKTTALYTYYPYRNNTDCQNIQPFLLATVKDKNVIHINIYPDKMQNMQECPFYISTNKLYHSLTNRKIQLQEVTEAMVKLLQEAMNFTPIITTKDYLGIDSNQDKNWSESLDDVITGVTNISTCSISVGVEKLSLLDYSFPYFRMRIVWLAPPTRPGHVWLRLLSPLNGYMWLILMILILLLKTISCILKMRSIVKFSRRYFIGINTVKGVAFRMWGVMVGQPIKVYPRRFRDFYIVGLWILFTFVVRSAYQSVLIGALKTETVVGNYASLRDAYEHGYKFGGRAGMLLYFEHDPQILEEFEIVPEIRFEELFNQVLQGKRKFVFATSLEYAWAYCLSRGIMEDECGHVLSDSIMTVPLVIWMKKNSPFLDIVSTMLQRFLESGLLDINAKPVIRVASQSSSDPTPLTRNQTLSCFLCLLAGYTLSLLMLCFENLHFIKKRI